VLLLRPCWCEGDGRRCLKECSNNCGVGAIFRFHPFWQARHGSVAVGDAIGCDVLQASVCAARTNAGKLHGNTRLAWHRKTSLLHTNNLGGLCNTCLYQSNYSPPSLSPFNGQPDHQAPAPSSPSAPSAAASPSPLPSSLPPHTSFSPVSPSPSAPRTDQNAHSRDP
jgi:hypothetical protein